MLIDNGWELLNVLKKFLPFAPVVQLTIFRMRETQGMGLVLAKTLYIRAILQNKKLFVIHMSISMSTGIQI